jgi:hypothetical protein
MIMLTSMGKEKLPSNDAVGKMLDVGMSPNKLVKGMSVGTHQ